MTNWKDIEISGVSGIDKCVGEFDVWAIGKVPYAKFKVKIYESGNGGFFGFSNIRLRSLKDGMPDGEAGFGDSISEALENTIQLLIKKIDVHVAALGRDLSGDDIEYSDPIEF